MMMEQVQTVSKERCFTDNESVLCVISDLLKTLIGANNCVIFLHDQLNKELVSVYSDLGDEIRVKVGEGIVGSYFSEKKAFVNDDFVADGEWLGFDISDFCGDSVLSYTICNDDEEALGVIFFTAENKKVFTRKSLQLIEQIKMYLVKELEQIEVVKSGFTPAREISLALYDKNLSFIPTLKNDLYESGFSTLFEFSIFAELKHKVQNHREKSFILICMINNIEDILEVANEISNANIPTIMIGPDHDDLILCAGRYNVSSYLPLSRYTKESISQKISDNFYKIVKDPESRSFLNIFIGTTGGTGTTTISSNLANVLSSRYALKNVLYMDFSTTKAISNIFFGIPTPQKSIVDFMHIDDFSEENMLSNGLYQIKNNLYMIPGIQSHIDREEIINKENEQKIINTIYRLKNLFDFVIIDAGLAKDSELQIAIEEISDKIFIVTELTTIHVSILQTYYELMKKAGWKDKIKIVINREDSQNAISIKDASEILNSKNSKEITFDIHIPNGGDYIRECWNFGKLITDEYPNAKFSKAIKESRFYSDLELGISNNVKKPSLLKKIFSRSPAGLEA